MELKFYKKGQGYYTRMCTALAAAFVAAVGCWTLQGQLGAIRTSDMITADIKSWIQAGVPLLIFSIICWTIFKVINMPRFADFLIATEGEMKKVSWSTKKEIITSTKVVVITVMIVALILTLVDLGFANLFRYAGVLEVIPD
ncbi:MAG: preprotein translocase subunit SecE [Sedimentisphaerales bacterium]|nr:preprotein translocase subunit SecE [Sedimentisphaerales bacterium]